MGKTEEEKIVKDMNRNEVLLDLIASGYLTIHDRDMEIERLKNRIDSIIEANDTLHEKLNTVSDELRRLKSIDIDDGK